MSLTVDTDEIADALFRRLSEHLADRTDPLELLADRDLASELKMSLASLKRKVVSGEIEDADGNNGIRKVWTRELVNQIKLGMVRREV